MVEQVDVSERAAAIEYAIRDVVVPAVELEKQGHGWAEAGSFHRIAACCASSTHFAE